MSSPASAELGDFARFGQALVDALPEAAYVCVAGGAVVAYNARAAELWGATPQPGQTRFSGALRIWAHGRELPPEDSPMAEALRDGAAVRNREVALERADGSRVTVIENIEVLHESERVAGAICILRDITGRKRLEALRRAEREVLQQVVEGAPLSEVLGRLTSTLDRGSDGDLVSSILLLGAGGRLYHAAGAGLPPGYRQAIDGLPVGPSVGSCGTAAWRNETVIVPDIATDPLWAGYRDVAAQFGLRACWSAPIRGSDGAVLGTFAIYSRKPRFPRPEDRRFLEFVTRTAATAIERKRIEEDRARLLAREQAARAEAEAAREKVARILESIADAFLAVDKDFCITYVNSAAEQVVRRTRDALLGKVLWHEFPAIAGTFVEAEYRRALRDQVPVHVETWYGDPVRRWFEANAYPAEDGGLSIYFRDITARKQGEERLRQSADDLRNQRQWLEAVLDLMPAPMLFIEPGSAKVAFANRAAHDIAGGSMPVQVPGGQYDTVYTCLDGQQRKIPNEAMPGVRVARGERVDNFQMTWLTPAGERALLVFGDTLPAMYGHPATGVITFQDITDLKSTEEALRQAQKLESLGVLAGGIAHDFNNLLTGILGNASLVLEDLQDGSPDKPLVENIVNASERAAELTRQMLAYSGQGRFVIQPVNLSEQVRDIGTLLETSISRMVQLDLRMTDTLPPIMADASQLQQVIMNLVINAAEAVGHERYGIVRVSTGVQTVDAAYLASATAAGETAPGEYVFLEVEDNGCGMDEATKARIFDPFFTTKFTGRGLGLAAVLGIVRGHKGAITVTSVPHQGTTVRVVFPAACAMPEPGREPAEAPALRDLAGSGLILVVDDEQVVRQAARSALKRYGYSIALAANGKEAVEMFRNLRDRVALVLLDLTMPVMDGEETLRELQAMRPDVKVILSSGYNEAEAVKRFAGRGLAGFIKKPYVAASLAAKIKEALEPRPAAGGPQ